MCKCKVCSDKQGYEELMSQLDNLRYCPGDDFDYKKANEITKQLDEYEAYWYYGGPCSVSVFLYNDGEELDYEEYERRSADAEGQLRNFHYCPKCGRKLD